LCFGNQSIDYYSIIQLFGFLNLNVLHLSLNKEIEENNEISFQSLKELKLLNHLILQSSVMTEIFFKDIDKHLLQLNIWT
jgi:hypothetical protein